MQKQHLNTIVKLIRDNRRQEATRALAEYVSKEPFDISAWEMLADLVDSPEQKADCYQQILYLYPPHEKANDFLQKRKYEQATSKEATPASIARLINFIGSRNVSQKNSETTSRIEGNALPPGERKQCPKCQASIPKTAARCQWCGTSLEAG